MKLRCLSKAMASVINHLINFCLFFFYLWFLNSSFCFFNCVYSQIHVRSLRQQKWSFIYLNLYWEVVLLCEEPKYWYDISKWKMTKFFFDASLSFERKLLTLLIASIKGLTILGYFKIASLKELTLF